MKYIVTIVIVVLIVFIAFLIFGKSKVVKVVPDEPKVVNTYHSVPCFNVNGVEVPCKG